MLLDKNLIVRMLFKEFCFSLFFKLDFINFSWENFFLVWVFEGENVKIIFIMVSVFGYCC